MAFINKDILQQATSIIDFRGLNRLLEERRIVARKILQDATKENVELYQRYNSEISNLLALGDIRFPKVTS